MTDDIAHAETAAAGLETTATEPAGPRAKSAPARRLAHFVLESELGRGGMGVVYRARDLSLDREVAIKVLADEVALSPDRRQRFYREARAQARINHPNVGHIYYIGEQDGAVFFAMELIDGESVAEMLESRGKLEVPEAIDIIRQAARGLAEAERHGVVHRDVKPSNLMIDRHGVVKVLDFGIAAEIAVGVGEAEAGGPIEQTTLAGTPLYAAPEQGRGEPVDFRADVYALGVTLHQMVTGAPPFHADSADELVTLHSTAARPRFSRKQVGRREPQALDALTDRMMAKNPTGRFASYDELLAALEMAEPETGGRAQLIPRGAAALIDLLLWAMPMALMQGFDLPVTALAWSAVWFAYQIIALGRYGATAGQRLLGLEVVSVKGSGGMGARRATIRTLLLYGAYALTAGLERLAAALESSPLPPPLPSRTAIEALEILEVGYTVAALVAVVAATVRGGGRAWWDRAAGTEVRTTGGRRRSQP